MSPATIALAVRALFAGAVVATLAPAVRCGIRRESVPLGDLELSMRWTLAILLSGCTAQAGGLSVIGGGGGGGGVDLGLWSGVYQEGSVHADSDYFDDAEGAGVPTGWSEWDVGADLTVSEGTRGLTLDWGSARSGLSGVYKASTSGDHLVTVHFGGAASWDVTTRFFLGLAEDLDAAPSTANAAGMRYNNNGPSLDIVHHTAWNVGVATVETETELTHDQTDVYLRLCVDATGSDLRTCVSSTGRVWRCSGTHAFSSLSLGSGYTHTVIGASGADAGQSYVDMYRIDADTDCFLPVGGKG